MDQKIQTSQLGPKYVDRAANQITSVATLMEGGVDSQGRPTQIPVTGDIVTNPATGEIYFNYVKTGRNEDGKRTTMAWSVPVSGNGVALVQQYTPEIPTNLNGNDLGNVDFGILGIGVSLISMAVPLVKRLFDGSSDPKEFHSFDVSHAFDVSSDGKHTPQYNYLKQNLRFAPSGVSTDYPKFCMGAKSDSADQILNINVIPEIAALIESSVHNSLGKNAALIHEKLAEHTYYANLSAGTDEAMEFSIWNGLKTIGSLAVKHGPSIIAAGKGLWKQLRA